MSTIIFILVASTGFEYLNVDPVAHRAGMGYGLFDDGYSVHYNPAGLAFGTNTYYSVSYMNYIGGTNFGFLGYERKQLGIGVQYFYSGQMKKTDALGNEYGSFGANFIDLSLGKGFFYKNLGLGLTIKGVYTNIDTLYALGTGIDMGALYMIAKSEIQIGFAVKNLGYGIKPFVTEREMFPYEIDISGIKKFNHGWVGLDLVKPALAGFGLRVGGGYSVNPVFMFKASYNSLLSSMRTGNNGLDVLTGLTGGFTVTINRILIDYCYSPYFDLGGGHRISINVGG